MKIVSNNTPEGEKSLATPKSLLPSADRCYLILLTCSIFYSPHLEEENLPPAIVVVLILALARVM